MTKITKVKERITITENSITGEMMEQFYQKCDQITYKDGSLYDLFFVFDKDILGRLIGLTPEQIVKDGESGALFAKTQMVAMKIMRMNAQLTRELACIITKQNPSEITIKEAVEVVQSAVPFLY